MGQDIKKSHFCDRDYADFSEKLQQETELLKTWFKDKVFETDISCCGFELEGWLVDNQCKPTPQCLPFLEKLKNPNAVPELSLFNFEYNSNPCNTEPNVLASFHRELTNFWEQAFSAAHELDITPLSIGILPSLEKKHLGKDSFHPNNRYQVLDQKLRDLRGDRPIQLQINGEDEIKISHDNMLLETVATSLQIHLQLNANKAVHYYNTGFIIAAPMVAVAANSPFLFGQSLWDETRIPVFEQVINKPIEENPACHHLDRVTFGTGYVHHSIIELFEENLSYPVLLPEVVNSKPEELKHLKLHNGTIWRWNRPIIDLNGSKIPHIRLEHRVAAASTSAIDTIANIAFFLGLMRHYAYSRSPAEKILNFITAKENFYHAAKDGLNAKVSWNGEKNILLQELMLKEFIPKAKEGLKKLGIATDDIKKYIDHVIRPRVETGMTGAVWQRQYLKNSSGAISDMLSEYIANQHADKPVHEWK